MVQSHEGGFGLLIGPKTVDAHVLRRQGQIGNFRKGDDSF